jgi:hypothetical protein
MSKRGRAVNSLARLSRGAGRRLLGRLSDVETIVWPEIDRITRFF